MKSFSLHAFRIAALLVAIITFLPMTAEAQNRLPKPVDDVTTYVRSAARQFENATTDEEIADGFRTLVKIEPYRTSEQVLNDESRRELADAFYNMTVAICNLSGDTLPPTFREQLGREMPMYKTLGEVVAQFWDSMMAQIQ